MLAWLKILCFFSIVSFSGRILEDFSSSSRFSENSTAVWNLSKKIIHLPFKVTEPSRTQNPKFFQKRGIVPVSGTFSIGTGKDGTFDTSTYCNFDINNCANPSLISLDTSKTYEFTDFTIEENFTVTGYGAEPLIIRIQGNAIIAGSLDISGKNGENISNNIDVTPLGGESCCGGGKGGDGGSNLTQAKDGGSPVENGMGKAGGTGENGGGGGGGGANSDGANIGKAVAPASYGAKGTEYWVNSVENLLAGSGGGGGGAHTTGLINENGSGGGGGGGGGALYMTVGGNLTVTSTGSIYSNGGNGGGTQSTSILAGGGGGGSGGSIVLFVGGTFYNCNKIIATFGNGGTTLNNERNGGKGANGGIRIVDGSDWANKVGCGGNEVENPLSTYNDFGRVVYSNGSDYFIESNSIDTGNSAPTAFNVELVSNTPDNTSITVQLKGSSDNFQTDETNWVTTQNFNLLDGKRYVKFKLVLSSNNQAVSPVVESITIIFTEKTQSVFNFTFASCASVKYRVENSPFLFVLLLFFIFLVARMRIFFKP